MHCPLACLKRLPNYVLLTATYRAGRMQHALSGLPLLRSLSGRAPTQLSARPWRGSHVVRPDQDLRTPAGVHLPRKPPLLFLDPGTTDQSRRQGSSIRTSPRTPDSRRRRRRVLSCSRLLCTQHLSSSAAPAPESHINPAHRRKHPPHDRRAHVVKARWPVSKQGCPQELLD